MNLFLIYFLVGLSFSYLLLRSFIKFLKKYFLDNPNKRSLHRKPIPRGGGLAFILPVLIYDLFSFLNNNSSDYIPLSLLCIPLIFISVLDDLIKVSSKYRYIFQLISSFLILRFGNYELFLSGSLYGIFLFIFLMIFLTASINFTNFMDGSDGLVSGCMFIFFLTLNLKLQNSIPITILLGALANFIYWNWSPAKVFMGDVGSTFLGIYFSANLLQMENNSEIIGLLLVCSPFFGDALITIFRRFLARENIFKAHRQHLYQRLYLGKLSKQEVALIYILQSSFLSFVFLKLNFLYEMGTILMCAIIMYLLEKKYALSFKESKKSSLI